MNDNTIITQQTCKIDAGVNTKSSVPIKKLDIRDKRYKRQNNSRIEPGFVLFKTMIKKRIMINIILERCAG